MKEQHQRTSSSLSGPNICDNTPTCFLIFLETFGASSNFFTNDGNPLGALDGLTAWCSTGRMGGIMSATKKIKNKKRKKKKWRSIFGQYFSMKIFGKESK